jgi:hypothetical protein
LQQYHDHRTDQEYFINRLQQEFGDYADTQLDTTTNWARYEELFAFGSDSDELFLES